MAKNSTRFHDADESGFLTAGDAEVTAIIDEARKEKAIQKSVNRRITVAAAKRQIDVAGDDTFHFGAFLDWRGRLYCHGAGIATQGKDFSKGCIQAGEGKRLGIQGLRHLMCGVATTWGQDGLDKASMRDRVAGVRKMLADGSLAAMVAGARPGCNDPSYAWRLADEPVQFLALASDLLAAIKSGKPTEYESSTFIGYDATCSGLQVLASVTGCVDTALLVNVLPRPDGKRADIYLSVADALAAWCAEEAEMWDVARAEAAIAANESGHHWAVYWDKQKITRNVTKNPVMVYCYGGTKRTFAGTIRAETKAPWKACMWLASVMYDDILSVLLPRAHAFMGALQRMARLLSSHGKAIAFTAADGLPFVQAVMETEKGQVRCNLADGRTIWAVVQNRTDKLSSAKQASGVAPNIVHHWDGLFLRNVVRALAAAGITDFFTVHDCFYLRAGDWARGWKIIRQVFVDTFSGDVAARIWADIAMAAGMNIGPCPTKGDLDLTAALNSEYLFS